MTIQKRQIPQKNPTRLLLNSKLEVELSLAAAGGDTWRKLLWLILEMGINIQTFTTHDYNTRKHS
jgi:hypothetical protein